MSKVFAGISAMMKKSRLPDLGTATPQTSSELDYADTFYSSDGNDLNIVQRREGVSTRPHIPATKCEKLTYIRSYVSAMGETDIFGVQRIYFNELFWKYLHCVLMRTLPTCYIHFFLGSYAAEHHLFLPKMAPLMHGVKIIWIFISSMQLMFFSHMMIAFLDFVIAGVLYQEPWNSFRESVIRETIAYGISLYAVYNNILWILSSLLINQIFKKHIWKILHISHWLLAGVLACILLFFYYYAVTHDDINSVTFQPIPELKEEKGMDFTFVAESMTTPPILHILTSRSKGEVKLSSDSALLVTSNTLFYLFRAYVVDQLLRYCIFITNAQLHVVADKFNMFHFLWPIFFWSIHLDTIITIPFCTLILFVDYLTFTITHQCLIEIIVYEWPQIKRWQAAVLLCILIILLTERTFKVLVWFMVHGIHATIYTELIIITTLYPFSRLVEDITFHDGIAPSFIIIFGLRLMCLYYIINFFVLLYNGRMFLKTKWNRNITLTFLVLLLLGLLIKLYDIISKQKDWKLIFVPVQKWGPFNFTLRLLRKKFDSSNYIASQGPRDLSRYFIRKAEPKTYRLDVRYELPPKSKQYMRPTN